MRLANFASELGGITDGEIVDTLTNCFFALCI